MRILVKGYYGFKNFGDEFILLPLLTWIEEQYQPDTIDILCGDVQWLEQWVLQHRMFIPPIFDKLHFLPMPSFAAAGPYTAPSDRYSIRRPSAASCHSDR